MYPSSKRNSEAILQFALTMSGWFHHWMLKPRMCRRVRNAQGSRRIRGHAERARYDPLVLTKFEPFYQLNSSRDIDCPLKRPRPSRHSYVHANTHAIPCWASPISPPFYFLRRKLLSRRAKTQIRCHPRTQSSHSSSSSKSMSPPHTRRKYLARHNTCRAGRRRCYRCVALLFGCQTMRFIQL